LNAATYRRAALERVGLAALMDRTEGRPEFAIGLIDGPVARTHPELNADNIREVAGGPPGTCSQPTSAACMHGTFVAGVLCAKRGSAAPAIAPGCTLLSRAIFSEEQPVDAAMPSATPEELAAAIGDAVAAGARVINVSAGLARPSPQSNAALERALDRAARAGVLVIAAAGNQGIVGSSPITRHPWVVPVVACDLDGKPLASSNLCKTTAGNGLAAPGEPIESLGADGEPRAFGGTSAAAPFVTGALALVWSEHPRATAVQVKMAIARAHAAPRRTIVPPVLDALAIYRAMA
jgi:subtilisin family serine protease